MTQPQILAVFADAAADPRFPIALGIAALTGLVRGFTGFGSALIYMPLVSAVYSPQIAAATLLLIDSISSLPVSIRAIPQCNWREVTPVTIAGAVALPFGVAILVYLDPLLLRWLIAVLVLVALARRRVAVSRQADDRSFGRGRRARRGRRPRRANRRAAAADLLARRPKQRGHGAR